MFSSKAKCFQDENGASVNISFNISIIIIIQGHMHEINTVLSEIHEHGDLDLGVENFVELGAEISIRELKFKFLKRSVLVLTVHNEIIKPKERRYVKVEVPFLDEISGLGIIKLLGSITYDTLNMKVKFERYKLSLKVTNDSTQVIAVDSERAIAILDNRSLGYYKIQQGVLQQRLRKYHSFELLQNIF